MNAADFPEDLRTWSQQQVKRVGKEDAAAGGLERVNGLSLYGGLRADRHEDRSLHFPVQGLEAPGPGA